MALPAALVPHASTRLDELRSPFVVAECELQDAGTPFDAIRGIRGDCVVSTELFAACTSHDFRNPPGRVEPASRRHRLETFVVVVVAVEDEIDVVVIEHLP